MASPSVLIAGTVALDSIHTPTAQHADLLGGSASYAALSAAYRSPVHLCAVVGHDFPADARALFAARSIDTANVQTIADCTTFRWTGRYHENMNHRETLDVSLAVLERFAPALTPAAAASPILLLANMSPDNQLAVLAQMQGQPFVILDSMDLWINIARERLLEVMGKVDLFVINEDEAILFTECRGLVAAGRKLLTMGPRHVIVKKGEHGAMLFGPDGAFYTVPAYPLDGVADPTGAGDTFAGGLAGYLAALGRPPQFADLKAGIVHGSVLASFTCEAFGVHALAAVTPETLQSRLDSFRAYTTW